MSSEKPYYGLSTRFHTGQRQDGVSRPAPFSQPYSFNVYPNPYPTPPPQLLYTQPLGIGLRTIFKLRCHEFATRNDIQSRALHQV